MNCVASTYNASGKLVGCTEQELNAIISVQLYTVFAMGTGLYIYKSLTAENWADIAIQIGWGCVSAFTRTKRFAIRRVIPCICNVGSFIKDQVASVIEPDSESEVSVDDDHCYVRVIKDGTELHGYSSIFGLINHLSEYTAKDQDQAQDQAQDQDQDSDDVVDVQSEQDKQSEQGEADQIKQGDQSKQGEADQVNQGDQIKQGDQVNQCDQGDQSNQTNQTNQTKQGEESDESESDELESESESSDTEEDIKDQLARIDKHTMQFDFVMCQVPTMQTATSTTPQCMHVIKYDGFPRDVDGLYFCDRTFKPVDHRMIEIVLQYAGAEYELDLSSPDNFYVVGNKLLDPAFLKWFMRKNHNINLVLTANRVDSDGSYTIKCIDHDATLRTLLPCNYLHVTETGFEVHDSGLV